MSRPVLLVCATAFLYMLGLSVLFPVLPRFTQELGIGEGAAGVLLSSYAFGAFLTGSLWGRVSQRFGRKPVLLLGLVGFTLTFLFFGLGTSFAELLVARLLGGLLAGSLMSVIPAYIADVTGRGPERATAMGMFGAAAGLGVMFGFAVGGALGEIGPRVPFLASAGIGAFAVAAVAALLPESLAAGSSVVESGAPLGRVAVELAPFLGYSFLVQVSRSALESTIGFLALKRFGAGPGEVGILLFVVTLVAVAIQGGAIRPLSARFSDRSLMRWGTVLVAAGLLGVGFVPTWSGLWVLGIVFGSGAALVEPTFRAELSRVGERFQGEAQGLNSAIQSLARVVAFASSLVLFSAISPEVAFSGAAAVAALAAVLAWVWLPVEDRAVAAPLERQSHARR